MAKDLRERLARFDRSGASGPVTPGSVESCVKGQRSHGADPLSGVLRYGARWEGEAPEGHLRVERELEGGIDWPGEVLGLLGAVPETIRQITVLDTETTGLESGTGTLVFVVGFVHWSRESRRLVQLFLPEPAGEHGFLAAASREIGRADMLLSYNGRGFDIPRLRSRMRIHRLEDGVLDRPHLDLLYPARNLVRGWLGDARLKTVEEELLGEVRSEDLPGEFAPGVYRELLLDARDAGLGDVLRHNAMDIESLPRLALWLARHFGGDGLDELPASCSLGVARSLVRQGHDPHARRVLRSAVDRADPRVRPGLRAELAQLHRRAGEYAEAVAEWSALLADQPGHLPARVELAKLLEHRLGDLSRARQVVVEGRDLLALGYPAKESLKDDLAHRNRRLIRKMASR